MDLIESESTRKVEEEMEINHFSHDHHPLEFISVVDQSFANTIQCSGCEDQILEEDDGWRYYRCKECKYYLHKKCVELASQIDHPFHPEHLLSLFPKSPYEGQFGCNFCDGTLSGFVYHCDVCNFDLHVNCALLQSSIAPNFPNSLHPHPLFFLPNHNNQVKHDCSLCSEPLSGPIYHCSDCSYESYFNLHKGCAELDPQMDHPFHPEHLLSLSQESPSGGVGVCNLCDGISSGFGYYCDGCNFYLHVDCAFLQSSIAPNFPIYLHDHPMTLLQNHMDQLKSHTCPACEKPLSGPIYHCSVCPPYELEFNIHKECGDLPLEITHPYDRNHPLTLLRNPPSHPEKCSCHLCKTLLKGFVYSCSLCNFDLTLEDVNAPRTITNPAHQHPWTLLSRQMSFICDFCGTTGDRTPYLCATCDLLVHKNCTLLPCKILITRHQHIISHSYSLRRDNLEERLCRICYEEVNTRYGCYHCLHTDCNYIAHALCATDKAIWDGTIIPEDCDESSMEPDSSNLITDIFEQMCIEEQMVAIEIKHAFHDHNLRLTFSGKIKDDDYSQCDGCMRSISTPFYGCDRCKFFIHKDCAEFPREKRHPFHKHLLTLTESENSFYLSCNVCHRCYDGFTYKCSKRDCDSHFRCDIRCIQLSDTLKHSSHEHSLFLVHNRPTKCSGCLATIYQRDIAYRCMKRCGFTLDMKCATEPLTTSYKYDKHPLTLTYSDDSSPSQHYCDLCEEGRDPKNWFYHCADCDNSLHSNCALGGFLQFKKLGSKFDSFKHPHPFTVVKNIWNCPPCKSM